MRHLLFIGLLTITFGCKKDKPETSNPPPQGNAASAYIVNEGAFMNSNASVSAFDKQSGEVTADIYFDANQQPLGDVAQSMFIHGNDAFIVVNNSQKIEVCNKYTMQRKGTISGFSSPRYILPVTATKAYVTDLYSNNISIIDLNSLSVTGSIPCNGWTESMHLKDGKAYVTNYFSDYLYVVDISTDAITDSIQLARGGNSIVEDKDGKLWVLCGGEFQVSAGGLFRLDPATSVVELALPFASSTISPWRLRINPSKDSLYFLNTDVYRMSIGDATLPANPWMAANGKSLYNIAIDPADGIIYLTDAIDFSQRGRVYWYDTDGNELGSFLAGIVPGEIVFVE